MRLIIIIVSSLIGMKLISTAFSAMTVVVAAAVQPSLPDTIGLEDVDIVAVKSDIATATVIDRQQIESQRIVAPKGVGQISPNLFMPDYGSRMTSSIYARGTGTRIDQPVVGLYVDNVPILNKDCYDFDLPDLDNVKVALGPQSTLFGRNTMSGIISLSTLSPLNYQGKRFAVSYASHNTILASAGIYGKLSDKLAMSAIGHYYHTDGQFRNAYNNSHCGLENQASLRWRTEWRPSESLSIGNNLYAAMSRTSGYPYEFLDTREINYNDTCFYRRNSLIDGISLKWLHKGIVVTSMTSLQYLDDNMTLDQDFLPQSYFTLTQKRHEFTVTEDAVAKGTAGNYSWLGGVFSFFRRGSTVAPVMFKEYGISQLILSHVNEENPHYPCVWDTPSFLLGSSFQTPTFNFGIYHESQYSLADVTFAAGIRLDYERAAINYQSECHTSYTILDAYTDPSSPTVFVQRQIDIDDENKMSKSHLELLPKASVTYRFGMAGDKQKRSLLKLSVAEGFKAGGFNSQMLSDVLQQRLMGFMGITEKYNAEDILSYKPEKSLNFELSAGLVFPDARLSVNAAAFFTNITDLQLTVFPDGVTTGRMMTNAGSSRSRGVELSALFEATSRLSLRAAWGFTDARFRHYDNGKAVFDGMRVPYAPANTLFASADYSLPLGKSRLADSIHFNVNCRGAGRIYWNEENTEWQNFYALLGASVTLRRHDYSVSLWGNNLTDSRFNTFRFVSISHTFLQRGATRQFGITLKLNIN